MASSRLRMVQDPQTLCRRHGLTYVESSELGLRRRRCGKGFNYLDPSGRTVHDKAVKARIKALAIPPAWTDVCIAHDGSAHIQAIGRDSEGRLQYRYHPEWEHVRSSGKERRLLRFGSALPRVRSAVKAALAGSGVTRTKVIAAVVRLIDAALLRPGHEEYARARGGRGAATLLKKDIAVEGDKIVVEFEGKGGKQIKQKVQDRALARVVRNLTALRGARLFNAPDGNGTKRPITAREVNSFIAQAAGTEISARDFRTFRASAAALASLTKRNGHDSKRSRAKAIVDAADEASEILANTRAVARSSYIHSSIIEAYNEGKLKESLFRGRLRNGLTKIESALMRFLERDST
jgi:DNA topoisomerase-1